MKKKIIPFLLLMFVLVPISVFAENETNNLLYGKLPNSFSRVGSQNRGNITDDDLETYLQILTNGYVQYNFSEPKEIGSYFIKARSVNSSTRISFYSDNNLIYRKSLSEINPINGKTVEVELSNVTSVRLESVSIVANIYSLKVFEAPDPVFYEEISDITGKIYYNSIFLKWLNPSLEGFNKVKIYEQDRLINEVYSPLNFSWIRDLKPDTNYTFLLTSIYEDEFETPGIEFDAKTKKVPEVEVYSKEIINYHEATFNYTYPLVDEFKSIEVYKNGKKIFITDEKSFTLSNLEPGEKNEILIKAITTDGYISEGIIITLDMPDAPEQEEVKDLKAVTTFERVDLSWTNPEYNPNFELVRIYRQDLGNVENNGVASLLLGKRVSAAGDYKPIFETNGTKFNDLTVEPSSKYEYLLKTENKAGIESQGQFITVTTDEEPTPQMVGVIGSENEDGDFTITWTSPTEGEVKIIVGGNEYATVPASDKSFTVPAKDVVKNVFGKPDVQVIPISKYGTPGKPIKPTEKIIGSASLPFSLKDVVSGAMELIKIVGPFIVLAFVLLLAPRIVDFVKRIFNSNNAKGWGRRL